MKRTLQNFGRIIISQNVGSSLKFSPFLPQPLPASIRPLDRTFHSSIVFNRRNSDDNNAKIIDAADWHNVQQVSVVNMSSKNGQPACYGIFWGEDDPMNIIQKCSPTRSNVFFSDGGDVKNKDELKDLDTMLSQINARFEKIQSPFEVFQKLKNVSYSDVNLEAFAADSDIYDPTSTEKTIFVHSAYIEKSTAVNGQPFKIAAYGVRFKGNESLDIKDRMGKFPSHLRAQMYGILKALEVAKMDGLKNVQIVCDSPIFLKYYKKGWKKNDGGNVANHPLYIEILKLADELNVSLYIKDRMGKFPSHLRAQMYGILKALEVAKMDGLKNVQIVCDSPIFLKYYKKGWKKNDGGNVANHPLYIEILKLADELNASFRSQAGNQSDDKNDQTGVFIKNFYAKYTEELASTAEEWKDVPKIHAVKCKLNPDSKKYGYSIFDQSSDNDGTCYSDKSYIVAGILKLLIPLLQKKIQEGTTRLVLRTDVHPLPLFLKYHVKKWESKGYNTAQGTPVRYADLYKEFSKLMEKIDLRIEYFKDPEEELDSKALDYCKEQVEKSENSRAID
uniref:RNase H type-1 domain-containing protein n=1 Tax=Panagrolaimus sp. PS1159 TaxID=55785 RepID=A0AC35F4R8_9BILA